jgi:hypothetical protein
MNRFVIIVLVLAALVMGTLWWRGASHDAAQPPIPLVEKAEPQSQSTEKTSTRRVEYAPLRPRVSPTLAPEVGAASTPLVTNAVSVAPPTNEFAATPDPALVEAPPLPAVALRNAQNLCISNAHEIVWAANVWCGVLGVVLLPDDLMLLTNQLRSPLPLICPSDPQWSQKATTNWAEFDPRWITYRLSHDVLRRNRNARVGLSFNFLSCPIHNRVWLGDRPAPPRGWPEWWKSMNPGKSPVGNIKEEDWDWRSKFPPAPTPIAEPVQQ